MNIHLGVYKTAMCISLLPGFLWTGPSAYAQPELPAVRQNTEALSRIKSYHVRISATSSLTVDGETVMPLAQDYVTEIWKQGFQRREFRRGFRSMGPGGVKEANSPHGNVEETGVDERHVRKLKGWDPEHPYPLPLEFGRNAKEFGSVGGTILPQDPTRDPTQREATLFLWDVFRGFSLEDVAKAADLVEVPAASEGVTRLQIKSAQHPELEPFVGTVVAVDHDHGSMISRIERVVQTPQKMTIVYEVLQFQEAEPGLWMPTQVQMTGPVPQHDGTRFAAWEIELCEVNVPLEADVLQVNFPEGVKVVESSPQGFNWYLWGKDGPLETFTDQEKFREHIYARAREYQGAGPPQDPAVGAHPERRWIIIINVALVAMLIVFTLLRRRMSRKA